MANSTLSVTDSKMSDDVNVLKDALVDIVLGEIGIDANTLSKLCAEGKGDDILNTVKNLSTRRSHDWMITHTYPGGSYGYVIFKGTHESAKKHAIFCLKREAVDMDNADIQEIERPIYTLLTKKVRVQVIPYASWSQ